MVKIAKPLLPFVLVTTALLASCAISQPDLTRIYSKQEGGVQQPPVVVIHGALGGRLYDEANGREVWPGSLFQVLFGRYAELALDIDPETLLPLESRLSVNGVAGRVGGVDFYGRILDVLEEAGGYRYSEPGSGLPASGKSYYVFSYDWRQDNLQAVRQLDAFIETYSSRLR